jgi:DNA repair photolyase
MPPAPPPPRRPAKPDPLKGHGAGFNPPNRFEPLRYEAEAAEDVGLEPDELAPDLDVRHLRDPSRTIVATNSSPDVGFDASVNPYRGCEHACVYCLMPETRILRADMQWLALGEVRVGEELVGFDEYPTPGRERKLRPSTVERVWWSRKPVWRITTERSEVFASAEHRWLQDRHFRWTTTERLRVGALLRSIPLVAPDPIDREYRIGYVAGLSLACDARVAPPDAWRIALPALEPLLRAVSYLRQLGAPAAIQPGCPAAGAPGAAIELRAPRLLEKLDKFLSVELASRSYRRGFLAGLVDAEGARGARTDPDLLERARRYGASLGFDLRGARLLGPVSERMRFLAVCRPALLRERERLWGARPASAPDRIVAIERAGVQDVVDIQTSTRTFYAAGLATHNCFARPTHEYLGFSAGLDFETRILVKEDAPELLRRALAARSWKPQVVALSGVTDPYQPIERRLRITRRCLEVLRDFRNPVAIVTKSRLVARDADLLGELARLRAAAVSISITTLDPELQRRMEPRAPRPALRLAAIEALARAGVPVGVLVAPVVPGLTEHELPSILRAAGEAGARHAGYVVLRLPHAVKELVDEWLARHYPERRDKVMNRVRELRGGGLYDSRWRIRQRGEGTFADQIAQLFEMGRRRAGIPDEHPPLSTAHFRRPPDAVAPQLSLFGG